MHRPGMSLVVMCALAGAAAAQTPAPAEPAPSEPAPSPTGPASAPSLDQQVTDQLAAQGIALSRHNLGVRISRSEAEGPWTVAVVDLGNGRVAGSVQVDAPADPEAALPVVTRAATDLAEQVGQRVNEIKFRLMSLRFTPAYDAPARPGRAPRQWQVFRGGRGEELDAPEFFQMVGRDDLATSYRRRHLVMIGGYAFAVAGFAAAAILTIEDQSPLTECQAVQGDQGQVCLDRRHRTVAPTVVALVAGLAGIAVGTYLVRHPQPIDEDDARTLADGYNQRLRGALGLRTAAKPSRLRDVALVPYAGRTDAGLALGGRF
jgi:xanthosine utilization system XapX-like protein